MAANPDSVSRYAPVTWEELNEEPEDISYLCDTCKHCLDIDGWPVCIADHNLRKLYAGTRITGRIYECDEWERADNEEGR